MIYPCLNCYSNEDFFVSTREQRVPPVSYKILRFANRPNRAELELFNVPFDLRYPGAGQSVPQNFVATPSIGENIPSISAADAGNYPCTCFCGDGTRKNSFVLHNGLPGMSQEWTTRFG